MRRAVGRAGLKHDSPQGAEPSSSMPRPFVCAESSPASGVGTLERGEGVQSVRHSGLTCRLCN
eukprot:4545999-Prymnesium_polylepis.1